MESLKNKIVNCDKCSQFASCQKGPLEFRGKSPKVLLIGESPHKSWIAGGDPFDSASGKRIMEYLNLLGYSKEDAILIEAAKCLVEDRRYLKKMMANCSEILRLQIQKENPELIISLGKTVAGYLGALFDDEFNMITESKINGVKYVSLYHPSPINPNNHKWNTTFLGNLLKMSERNHYTKT